MSSDFKGLLNTRDRVYFDFSEYGGAVMANAQASLCAQISEGILYRAKIMGVMYTHDVKSVEKINRIGKFLVRSDGRPNIVLNLVFGISIKDVASGFSNKKADVEDRRRARLDVTVTVSEKLSRHHVVLHGEGSQSEGGRKGGDASIVTTALHTESAVNRKKVMERKLIIDAYDKRVNPQLLLCNCEVIVEKIGVHCSHPYQSTNGTRFPKKKMKSKAGNKKMTFQKFLINIKTLRHRRGIFRQG